MSDNDINIRARFLGAREAVSGAKQVEGGVRGMGKAAKETEGHTRRLGGSFVSAREKIGPLRVGVSGLTGALIGGTVGFGLLEAVKATSERFKEHQIIEKQTSAALRSTGKAANVNAEGIGKLAESIQSKSGIDAEQIQQSENMLLTFRGIRNEAGKGNKIFNQSTKAAANMSAAFQAAGKSMSPSEAALQLGKALNDPVKGMTRLQRVGVTFTKQQTDQVAALVKTGDTMGAQKVILGELSKEFGGSATARGKTFQGALDRMRLSALDLGQTIFKNVAPALTKGLNAAAKFVTQMKNGTGQGGRFRDQLAKIWKAVKPVAVWVGKAASNIFKFASHHPALVKTGAALFVAYRALKLMKFGAILSGISKIARTKAGASAVKAITGKSGLGGLAGKLGPIGTAAGGALSTAFGYAALAGVAVIASEFADNFMRKLKDQVPEPFKSGIDVTRYTNPLTGLTAGPHDIVKHGSGVIDTRGTARHGGKKLPGIARGLGVGGHKKLAVAVPAPSGGGDGGVWITHTHVHLDGKEIAVNTAKHTRADRNRR